jgi:predicted GNAT family acetyltransferase
MSKTKRSGDRARIAALEKQVRQLRAGIRKDILHAVRAQVAVALREREETAELVASVRKVMNTPRVHPISGTVVTPEFGADTYSSEVPTSWTFLGHVPTAEELRPHDDSYSEAEG